MKSNINKPSRVDYLIRIGICFFVLFAISFSFGYKLLPDPSKLTGFFFEWLANGVAELLNQPHSPILSDTRGMFYNLLMVSLLSVCSGIGWTWLDKGANTKHLRYWGVAAISYYLALQLLIYGAAKVFKFQFFLPEPNTLFTTIGNTPRDLLYWSVMGLSHAYSIFMGCIEIAAGILLLFGSTRLIGALLSTGVMLNVVAVNFGFDISVKLYSSLLLLFSVGVAINYSNRLKVLFLDKGGRVYNLWKPIFNGKQKWLKRSIKSILILWFIAEACYPAYQIGNLNDDLAERPYLHGAYAIDTFKVNGAIIDCGENLRWKRVFVHRQGYFIIQTEDENMKDFELQFLSENRLLLFDYGAGIGDTLHYIAQNNKLITISGQMRNTTIEAHCRHLETKSLKALENEFHWTID